MKPKPIEVVPFDQNWKVEFRRLKEMLEGILGDIPIAIEHVGSTSVEGLAAKPIIDLVVVIESYADLPKVIDILAKHGYEHRGDQGVEGREVFKRSFKDDFMTYHLYVCPKDGKGYLEQVAFRDYIRENEEARNEYAALKYRLAKEYRNDREAYCDNKTEFVTGILKKTLYKGQS